MILGSRFEATSLKPTLARFLAWPMMRTGVSWGSEVDLAAEKLMWQDILSALSLPTLWKRTIETICRRLHHCLHDDKQNFVHQKSLFIYLLSVGNEDWKTTENLRATVDQVKKTNKMSCHVPLLPAVLDHLLCLLHAEQCTACCYTPMSRFEEAQKPVNFLFATTRTPVKINFVVSYQIL